MLREAIARNGYKDVKECARAIKVPYDLFNKVVGGHLPKDAQLLEYAKKLGIDNRELILAAYREKAPDEMKKYFNSVSLLEHHDGPMRQILDLMDALNGDQLSELLQVAQTIRNSSRETCAKATSWLKMYQLLSTDLVEHVDSLILLALRHENISGVKEFREAVERHKLAHTGRRGRLRV